MKSIKDDYPTCARTYATLCLYGSRLNLKQASRYLGIKGYICSLNEGKKTLFRGSMGNVKSVWKFSTRRYVHSKNLEIHLDWLLNVLEKKKFTWHKFSGLENAFIRCLWISRYGHGGPMFSVNTMNRLVSLGLSIEFNFEYYER